MTAATFCGENRRLRAMSDFPLQLAVSGALTEPHESFRCVRGPILVAKVNRPHTVQTPRAEAALRYPRENAAWQGIGLAFEFGDAAAIGVYGVDQPSVGFGQRGI